MHCLAVGFATILISVPLAVGTAGAQTMTDTTVSYPISVGIAAGATIPLGDLGDAQSTGWNVEGLVNWTTSHRPLSLRADVAYNSLSGKSVTFPGGSFKTDNENLFDVTGDVAWHFYPNATNPSQWVPYILGGIGIYHFGGQTSEIESTSGSTNFGLNIGGGVIYELSGFSAFVEARLHNVFLSGGSAKFFPISFGLRFGGGGV
ncbi:MAG TPA: outer membrane beta-barrel protein [Gemmatimonadaceae bacterium]|nr:outer membrane beta-barrel protein [Gemmatimonadaceae bacterium]